MNGRFKRSKLEQAERTSEWTELSQRKVQLDPARASRDHLEDACVSECSLTLGRQAWRRSLKSKIVDICPLSIGLSLPGLN